MCVVFLVTLAGAVRATETNLVLNKPYDYFPVPKYGGPDKCTDEDDTIQLTDGYTHYTAGPIWRDKPPDDVRTAKTVIPSRRWQHVRMGIEDYMLLKMARERIDSLGDDGAAYRRQLDELVRTVLTNRVSDRGVFRSKRRELVELVEELGGKGRD
jgi:hypothetical protein